MDAEINSEAVFDRIKGMYGLSSDAAMARKLGIYAQDVPRMRKSGNLPYKQILSACPPGDWPMIFLGSETAKPSGEASDPAQIALMMKTLVDLGYSVTGPRPSP